MKKIFSILTILFIAGMAWSQSRLQVNYPDDMQMGDIEYHVSEAFVCATTVAEANKIMRNYINDYNIKKKIAETQKCTNFIDKNLKQGVIMKYTLENSALD